jgi:type VI protein secretion system component VasK
MATTDGQSGRANEHALNEEPKLSREIAKMALLFIMLLLAVVIPFTGLFFVAKTHPWLAICTLYGLMFSGMIVGIGYQSYRWKKADWERKKRNAADEQKWAEAKERLRRDARG